MPRVNSRLVPDGIYFGIDNGSSGLRAAYVAVEDGIASTEPVPIENNHNGTQSRLDAGDFDVMVPIDGEKPYYYGADDRDPSRSYARLKYLIPVLALNDNEIKKVDEDLNAAPSDDLDDVLATRLSLPPQCLPVLKLLRKTGRARGKSYLEDVAVDAFSYLKRYLDTALSQSKVASHRHLPVKRYHLTIPDQWEGKRQIDIYQRIFAKAFGIDTNMIHFCLESEAQHMYYHADESLRAKFRLTTPDASGCCFVMSNDFGGMSSNSALYTLYRNTDDGLHYCRVTDPVGTSGGSEEWEFHIAKLATRAIMKKLKGVEVDPESLQEMLDQFNMEKKKMRPDMYGDKEWSYKIFLDRPNDRGGTDRITETFQLSAARAIQQFGKSMKGPFESFERQLADAISRSKQSGYPLFVLVHGGMTKNKLFEDRIHKIASKLELEDVKNRLIFTAAFPGSRHRSCHLAMGASQLAVDSQTFEGFVQGGAAWGLQIRQHRDNPSEQWNNVAAYIPFKEGHHFHNPERKAQRCQDVMAGDKLKLVVDPLYNVKHPPSDEYVNCPPEYSDNEGDMLDARSCCYDLYTFDAVPQDDVWFRLRLSAEDGPSPDTAHLVVEKSCWQRGGRYGPYRTWLTMTIYYDSGSRLWLQAAGSAVEHISRAPVRVAAERSRNPREVQNRPSKRKAKATTNNNNHHPRSGPSTKRPRSTAALSRTSSSEPDDERSTPPQPQPPHPQGHHHHQHERSKLQQSIPRRVQLGPATRPPPPPPPKPSSSLASATPGLPRCPQRALSPECDDGSEDTTGYFSFDHVEAGY